jgi:hypothetical protein
MDGWKGLEFGIHKNLRLWCDNDGMCSQCAVVGVTDDGVILIEYKGST